MKKTWTVSGFLIAFACVIAFYFMTQLKIVNAWSPDQKQVVLANKIWKIHFTEKIDKKTLKHSTIFVKDDKGKKQPTKLYLSDDQKTVYIGPPAKGYSSKAKMYTLYIQKGLKSTLGIELLTEKKLSFVVQETLPVVGSKVNLNSYFLKKIKEDKESRRFFKGGKEKSSEDSAKSEKSTGSGQDVSGTNVQVEGIDEADIVKTDGKTIFQTTGNSIKVISAMPADQMKELADISFNQNFTPYQLFLHDEKLLVIGFSYETTPFERDSKEKKRMIAPMRQSTKALVYDVSNPEKPKSIREIQLEGSYMSARKTNGIVYLVSNHYPDYWMLEDHKEMDIRPHYADSASGSKMQAIDYNKIQYFPDSSEPNFTMIASFDLDHPEKQTAISTYLGSGSQMYMSKNNLYLAVPQPFVANLDDSSMVAPDTNIYKFSVKGMDVRFSSSAEIEGTILNQFSMDEHNGYFRVVTTKGYAWDENSPSSNQLYILDENLKQAGALKKLASGERIYSARFLGERIYMVTFKETDPLFVIDARNPQQPKVLGELKIPGFSNYLHPYDENHIIGFGQDTKVLNDEGSNQPRIITNGVKITMFDISDLSKPKEKFTEVIGGRGTFSELNYDHKALLFSKSKNLFAFPISVYQNNDKSEYEQIFEFQGAYVYNIDVKNGFSLKKKITHRKESTQYEQWEDGVSRLLYIGDKLYALSPNKITSYNLKTYEQIGELDLLVDKPNL